MIHLVILGVEDGRRGLLPRVATRTGGCGPQARGV